MKILLVVSSIDTCYERLPSIGLMNLYLIAKNIGCDVELIDIASDSYKSGLKRILSREYNIIGISCNFVNAAPYCMRYAKDIKEKYPYTTVIAGGNHATLVPEDLLFNKYDYTIYGEGEITFEEFLRRFSKGEDVKCIKGLCYLKEDKIVKTPPRELIEDLDTLPLNDYSEFDLEPYFKKLGLRYLSMETSRGCIYNCSFCSTVKMWGHKYRHKSPERIVKEFKICEKINLDFVFIEDDDAALDEQHLRNTCQLLIDENIKLQWGTSFGLCSIKDPSTFDLLAKSGCIIVSICLESTSPRILKAYRKVHTVEDHNKLCTILQSKGFFIHNKGLLGFPDETVREMLSTFFCLIKHSHIWHFSLLEPRPASDYWESWSGRGDPSQYKLFGKGNVFFGKRKIVTYFICRIFVLFYLLNPTRIYKALFLTNKVLRYRYRMHYFVAWQTLKNNFLQCVSRFLEIFINLIKGKI